MAEWWSDFAGEIESGTTNAFALATSDLSLNQIDVTVLESIKSPEDWTALLEKKYTLSPETHAFALQRLDDNTKALLWSLPRATFDEALASCGISGDNLLILPAPSLYLNPDESGVLIHFSESGTRIFSNIDGSYQCHLVENCNLKDLFEKIQGLLELKFYGSAVKLAHDTIYDFDEHEVTLEAVIIPSLLAALEKVLTKDVAKNVDLFVTGLPPGVGWLVQRIVDNYGFKNEPNASVTTAFNTIDLDTSDLSLGNDLNPLLAGLLRFSTLEKNVTSQLPSFTANKDPSFSLVQKWIQELEDAESQTVVAVTSPPIAEKKETEPSNPKVSNEKPASEPVAPPKEATPIEPRQPAKPQIPEATKPEPANHSFRGKKKKHQQKANAQQSKPTPPVQKAPVTPAPVTPAPVTPVKSTAGSQTKPTTSKEKKLPVIPIAVAAGILLILIIFFMMRGGDNETPVASTGKANTATPSSSHSSAANPTNTVPATSETSKKIVSAPQQKKVLPEEKAPPPPPPPAGNALILSNPAGADVYIDSTLVGRTPYKLTDMPPGHYTATIQLKDYEDQNVSFEILDQKTTQVEPKPLLSIFGTAELSADIDNTTYSLVDLNSNPNSVIANGNLPATLDNLLPGDYAVMFKHDAWMTVTQLLKVESRKNASLSYHFPRGEVEINSDPAGGSVYNADDELLGKTPLLIKDIPVGIQSYRIELEGYEEYLVDVEIEDNSSIQSSAEMFGYDRILTAAEVDVPPILNEESNAALVISSVLLPKSEESNEIKVFCVISATGDVIESRVLASANQRLNRYIISQVEKWKFTPAIRKGRPFAIKAIIPLKIAVQE